MRTVSGGFASAGDKTGLRWEKPPSFHERRSLSGRLYAEQKGINVLNLLGHMDVKTAALYIDSRGAEWISAG